MSVRDELEQDAKAVKREERLLARGLVMCDDCYDWFPQEYIIRIKIVNRPTSLCRVCYIKYGEGE